MTLVLPPTTVTIPISVPEVRLTKRYAEHSEIGGVSRVRHDRGERLQELPRDQHTGQMGHLAGCKGMFGKTLGHYLYRTAQLEFWSGRGQGHGDGGHDVIGCGLDFKACALDEGLARIPYERVFLPVRPDERHEGWVYVFVLVEPTTGHATTAYLVGWARDSELPEVPNGVGKFEGACCQPTGKLHPLPPLWWSL